MDFTQRNRTIDIFRSFTMLLMIFVNHFWNATGIPHWMQHAKGAEDFLGLADFVFPAFIFAIGLSIPYAIERRYAKGHSDLSTLTHILGRSFALIVMGVFLVNTESGLQRDLFISLPVFELLMFAAFFLIWNAYPATGDEKKKKLYTCLKILGWALLIFLAIIYRDPRGNVLQTRWWGILGLLGWAYLTCAFLYMLFRSKISSHVIAFLVFVVISILLSRTRGGSTILPRESAVYGLLQVLNIPPGSRCALCMAGIVTSLVSLKIAEWKTGRKAVLVLAVLAGLNIAGIVAHRFWILSKNMETPATVFFWLSSFIIVYCIFQCLVSAGRDGIFKVIRSAGTATLTCYMVPSILYALMGLLHIRFRPAGIWGILYCLAFAFACVGITALMEKGKIKLKI